MKTMKLTAALAMCGMLVACSKSVDNVPPTAAVKPKELEIHGDVRVDDYYWLRERENPEVIAYLEAENAYTDSIMSRYAGLQERLVEEMKSRIVQDDQSAPIKRDDYFYYTRYAEGQEYPIYCRREGSMEGDEEILLDVNTIVGDNQFFSVRGFSVSPDHKRFAYGVDTVGRRFYDFTIVDIESGETVGETINEITPNFEWANDSATVFYVKQHPVTLRSYQVFRRDADGTDTLIYQDDDETFYVSIYKSLAGGYVYIFSGSTISAEVQYLSADSPTDDPVTFLARRDDHEYQVADGGDRFFIRSNKDGENFEIFEAPLDNTAEEGWKVVIPHREDTLLQFFSVFENFVAVNTAGNAMTGIEILDRESGEVSAVEFDEEAYSAYAAGSAEYASDNVRVYYESMTTPDSVIDYNVASGDMTVVKEQPVLGGFDRNDYVTERRFATARDGTKVPVSLVYRKGTPMDGTSPLLQYGYGSYGSSSYPTFNMNRLSLLDRGFIFAIAHIRGGSEMGRQWYFDGRQLNKMNTFTDFIDVSKFLIEEQYTSPEHLYARGGSAGGLLMGAVVNMAPELYNGITTRVPFVDVVTTMLDEDIPLTTGEWDEWGDPHEKEFYDYMLSYSPYDQISAQDYPNILVTTGLHDSQVQYWEPAKYVARMRAMKTDNNTLILKTDMQAGHSGKTGRFQSLEDDALYFSFFLDLEGISE